MAAANIFLGSHLVGPVRKCSYSNTAIRCPVARRAALDPDRSGKQGNA